MKKTILIPMIVIIIAIIAILVLIFLPKFSCTFNKAIIEESENQEQSIGGQTDEHGCLGPAGYTWCEKKQTCLRIWEESCNDSILKLISEIESLTSITFLNPEETKMDWRVENENEIEKLELSGLKFELKDSSTEDYNKIAEYFRDNFESDIQNMASGIMGNLEGYVLNYNVCTVGYQFTESTKSSEGPIIPNTEKRDVTIQCGFFNPNLENSEENPQE